MTQKLVGPQTKVPVFKRMAFRSGLLKQDPREASKILSKDVPDETSDLGERVAALGKKMTKNLRRDGLDGRFFMESADGSITLEAKRDTDVWLRFSTTDETKTRVHFVFHMAEGQKVTRSNNLYSSVKGGKYGSVRISQPLGSQNVGQIIPAEAVEVYVDDVVEKEPEPEKFVLSRIETRSVPMEELSGIVEAIRKEHIGRGTLGAERYSLEKLPNVLIGVNPFNVAKLKVGELFRGRAEMGTGLAIERDESYCAVYASFPRKIWERAIIVLQKEGSSEAFEGETISGGKSFRFGFGLSELSDVKSFQIMFSN